MYYYIKGEKVLLGDGFAVIDAGGVGYKILTSSTSLALLSGEEQPVTMYVQLEVREDSQELYGFTTNEELSMYRRLTTVSGVGPKAALALLSVMSPGELAFAIMTDDTKMLTRAAGIGAKTAKRIILELRDKISEDELDIPKNQTQQPQSVVLNANMNEAAAALTVLGYSQSDAKKAVASLDSSMPTEDLVREALKLLM